MEEYKLQAREKWQIVATEDFVDNVDEVLEPENFNNWLKEQEFNREDSYLELSVKIVAR